MNTQKSRKTIPAGVQTGIILAVIIVLLGVIGWASGSVIERVVISMLIAVVFLTGQSIYTANSGAMSFGHVTFMGIGAYVAMYLTVPVGMKTSMFSEMPEFLSFLLEVQAPFWLAAIIGGAVAAVGALILSPAFSRLRGLPAGIATLSLLVVFFSVVNSWTSVTRGSATLVGIPRQTTIWNITVIAIIAVVIALLYANSKSGLQLKAAREDYEAATAVGVNVPVQMGKAWILSAFVAGAAGALYASFLTTFAAGTFFISLTFSYVVMIVVGGYLSLSGAVVGAIVIGILEEVLRRAQDGQFGIDLPSGTAELAMSVALLVMLVFAPMGIMRGKELLFPRRKANRVEKDAAEAA